MNKKFVFAFVTILLSFQLFAQNTTKSGSAQHRVVIQLTSNDTLVWKGLINNIKNMKTAWGNRVIVEVVAHGNGIDFLIKGKTNQQENITAYKSQGVVFVGCENTMRERKIMKENIIPEAGFVKMGIGEVVLKQEQGWSYIKSGF